MVISSLFGLEIRRPFGPGSDQDRYARAPSSTDLWSWATGTPSTDARSLGLKWLSAICLAQKGKSELVVPGEF